MKRWKKILAAACMLATACAAMTGCGSKPAVDVNNNEVNAEFSEYLVAEKVGNISRSRFMTAKGGLYYEDENGKFGVMSYEGLHDTGAIYASVEERGDYFAVTKETTNDIVDYDTLNTVALIDGKGNTLVPAKYAAYQVLNTRYVKASKVTDLTGEENALVYYFDDDFGFESSDGKVYYEGEWCVYDLKTGLPVEGVAGTTNCSVYANGNYVTWHVDENTRKTVNQHGEPLPEGARLFEDGSYSLENQEGEVFDTNGEKLFCYDVDGFVPCYYEDGYYHARKYTDSKTIYVLLDRTGQVVSAEMDAMPSISGELLISDSRVFNFDGETVLEGEYDSLTYDNMFGESWLARNDSYYTMIDAEGNVYFNGPFDDDHIVYTSDFVASEKRDGETYFYSHKDQDYTIKGYSCSPWLVRVPTDNSLYDLIDTMTGETLLTGYNNYSYVARNAFAYYVYAKYNGGADVYLIVSSAQLVEVEQRKENLYGELVKAFEEEGIDVTINTETGEMALDSSVLFGGDSAELTTAGKEFLNKFLKVYTKIAFSGDYEGFITKTLVEGHTAPVDGSTYESGLPLSQERADVVKEYCLSADAGANVNVLKDRLEAVGYSNSQPVYKDGEVDMAASRRVSFRFMVRIEF